jgi:hypothetical protein
MLRGAPPVQAARLSDEVQRMWVDFIRREPRLPLSPHLSILA